MNAMSLSNRVINMIRRALPQGRFASNVTIFAGGAALGQAVTVLVSPILTRVYTPDDFGVFGVYASVLGIIIVIASLRYEYALPLPEEDNIAANLMVLCFLLLFAISFGVSWIIYCMRDRILIWTNTPALKPYLWLIPIGVMGGGTYQIFNYWAIRNRDFVRIARTKFSRGVGRAIVQVVVGILHTGSLGLLLGQIAGETAGSLSLGIAAWKNQKNLFKNVNMHGVYQAGLRYKRFPLFSSWADLLEALGLYVPQLFLAGFYGVTIAGWFALGQRVIAAPLNIVVDSVAQVYFGEAARLFRDDPKSIKRLFLKLTSRLALIGGVPVVIICALATWLFVFVFGSNWEMAGRYVRIMGPMFAIRFVTVPLSHTLNILERQDLYSVWEGTRLALVIGGLLLIKAFKLSHIGAVVIYSLSMSVAYVILGIITWHALAKAEANRKII